MPSLKTYIKTNNSMPVESITQMTSCVYVSELQIKECLIS